MDALIITTVNSLRIDYIIKILELVGVMSASYHAA